MWSYMLYWLEMCIQSGRQARDGGAESLYSDRAARQASTHHTACAVQCSAFNTTHKAQCCAHGSTAHAHPCPRLPPHTHTHT